LSPEICPTTNFREATRLHDELITITNAVQRRCQALQDQLSASRAAFLEAQQQLLDRDEEYRGSSRQLLQARDLAESQLRDERTHLAKLREALEAWHARSEEEFQQSKQVLVAERDSAHQHALAAETRCRALELRIEHVVMEFPRRILRKIQRKLRRQP
jgi:predicted  nucleic acid-binding Zn-ribbon protein